MVWSKRYLLMWLIPLVIVAVFIIFLFFLYSSQEMFIFPATQIIYRTPASKPFEWDYEDVLLDVNGERTHGWFIPFPEAQWTVLFSHGNAGNIADRLESIHLLRLLGLSVLAYDYGGYGLSSGKPSEKRIEADIKAMWDYLVNDKGIAPNGIIVFGRSLGGAAAGYLASVVKPAAVILESTFCSIPDVVRDMPLGRFLEKGIRHRFPTLERITKITVPILIIHSPDDTVIPYKHGLTLFEHANDPKYFLEIRGDHNEGFIVSKEIYLQGWKKFLASLPIS